MDGQQVNTAEKQVNAATGQVNTAAGQVYTTAEQINAATGQVNAAAEQVSTATIFDIQRFSIHDGPGIRTTVFFKGCNLRCFWCHNPESYSPRRELSAFPDRCIGCGKCVAACQSGCHATDSEGRRVLLRERCERCGRCADTCYADALVMTGKIYTVDEVLKVVMSDAPFYNNSNGGMTCSGGEPLTQSEFVAELMRAAKAAGISTALDTAGNVDYSAFERVLPFTDLILYDLKCIDPELHRRVTGAGNALILENLRRLATEGVPIWIRIPVVPGVNDNIENMAATAAFLATLPKTAPKPEPAATERTGGQSMAQYGASAPDADALRSAVEKLEFLPYHSLGSGKCESLGMDAGRGAVLKPPEKDALLALARAFDGAPYEVIVN